MGPLARWALLALALPIAALPGDALAAPAVHELRASPQIGDDALRVRGRAPATHVRAGDRAGASSEPVLDSSADGTRTNGKILATDPRSGAYTCSGTALNTPSRSIVLTAGHCVIENGRAGKRISFVPAYDHGK